MASHNDYQLALRIPAELLAAIDAEVERVKGERPGARVQRSDVVREALMRAFFHHPQKASTIVKRERDDDSSVSLRGDGRSNGHGNGNGNGRQQHATNRDDDDSMNSH